jgi:hypothetical protein
MASHPSDLFALVSQLRESARRGDWRNAFDLATTLRDHTPPANVIADGEYLAQLRDALMVAKASRAQAAATLVRLNAAAGFNRVRAADAPARQKFAESPDF